MRKIWCWIAIFVFQFGFLVWLAWPYVISDKIVATVYIEAARNAPFSYLTGNSLRFSSEFARPSAFKKEGPAVPAFLDGTEVVATLTDLDKEKAAPDRLLKAGSSDAVALDSKVVRMNGVMRKNALEYGIEEFYFSEQDQKDFIRRAQENGETSSPRILLKVKVSRKGKASLESVKIGDKEYSSPMAKK